MSVFSFMDHAKGESSVIDAVNKNDDNQIQEYIKHHL